VSPVQINHLCGLSQVPSKTENSHQSELFLHSVWDSLFQEPINKAVKEFRNRLKAYVTAGGGHFEHSQ